MSERKSPGKMASPFSASGESMRSKPGTQADGDRARKRALDRQAQQAMRDRAKHKLHSLEQQVKQLSHALEQERYARVHLNARIQLLEGENAQLKRRSAHLPLDVLGDAAAVHRSNSSHVRFAPRIPYGSSVAPWEVLPFITRPMCTSDQILQAFISSRQPLSIGSDLGATGRPLVFSNKPNLCSMLLRDTRSTDETSNIIGDIIKSYSEIDTLPKQVAIHYTFCVFVKVYYSYYVNK